MTLISLKTDCDETPTNLDCLIAICMYSMIQINLLYWMLDLLIFSFLLVHCFLTWPCHLVSFSLQSNLLMLHYHSSTPECFKLKFYTPHELKAPGLIPQNPKSKDDQLICCHSDLGKTSAPKKWPLVRQGGWPLPKFVGPFLASRDALTFWKLHNKIFEWPNAFLI